MISLRKAATELERLEELKQTLAKCYGLAIKSSAEYAVELDPHSTEYFRQRLQLLDSQCGQASAPEHYSAVQASLRGELRNYRDQAREQMSRMRKDLQNAAAAMRVFAETVSSSGENCELQLRQEIDQLEALASSDDIEQIRCGIESATGAILHSYGQLRRNHQLVVTQLQDEIRTLHQAMDNERSRMERDHASGAWNRQKLNERIEHLLQHNDPFCVLLVSARNLRRLERQYSPGVITEALRGLVQQFDGVLGGEAMIGRWSEDIFSAILEMDPSDAMALSTEINRKLSMSYPVWTSGVAQMLTIETSTGIVDRRRDSDAPKFYRKLEQMAAAMAGPENKPAA
ncbi:MAG: diguanylate cyclase [Acidobacteriia bacterium]|nr:diguanylate cyclase [Terriglobia bacterium]